MKIVNIITLAPRLFHNRWFLPNCRVQLFRTENTTKSTYRKVRAFCWWEMVVNRTPRRELRAQTSQKGTNQPPAIPDKFPHALRGNFVVTNPPSPTIFVVRKGYNLKKLRFSGLFLRFQVILGLLRKYSIDGWFFRAKWSRTGEMLPYIEKSVFSARTRIFLFLCYGGNKMEEVLAKNDLADGKNGQQREMIRSVPLSLIDEASRERFIRVCPDRLG